MSQDIRIPATQFLQTAFRPAVVTWNRLEGRPRREDFSRSLRAEVRDPLWMLCRQWQLGEYRAADAGSAVLAKVQVDTMRLDRYAARGGAAVAYDDTLPLETRVEAEPIERDLRTRIQMGRHWHRLLEAGPAAGRHSLYLDEYAFLRPTDPESRSQLLSDARAHALFRAVEKRVVDGGRLLTAIESGDHAAFVVASAMSGPERDAANAAAAEFLAWFRRLYRAPEDDEDGAWAPSYLEYRFACAAPRDGSGEQIVLTAEAYHHGHLDWYSFDIDAREDARLEPAKGTTITPTTPRAEEPITFIPNRIEFGGMPNVRWWELEDRRTDLGGLRVSTTDVALLMLAEFGLVFGNDWSVVPYDLAVGSLATVRGVVVTDVFGVRTFVRAAGSSPADAWQRWNMFELTARGGERTVAGPLFLAPAAAKSEEGEPIERVLLARDEIANMVWAIEDIIPGPIGDGTPGYEAATDLATFLTRDLPAETGEPAVTAARIRYRLGTTVPENWIPFIAVHEPGSNREVRLQRAAMPRLAPGDANTVVEPRGALLREGLDGTPKAPYFVHEEEARQAGSLLVRAYQRTRWWDGRIYTWLGRRKLTGRGESSSALEFDRIEAVPTDG
jgi:hypothetical protein